jgi:1-acyl-sn-glycerol-3-phosphate acyltransferase
MSRVVVVAAREPLVLRIVERLVRRGTSVVGPVHPDVGNADGDEPELLGGGERLVYVPPLRPRREPGPDLAQANAAFATWSRVKPERVVVVSSAEVYGVSRRNPGLIAESRTIARATKGEVSQAWLDLEASAREHFGADGGTTLTILRPCPTPMRDREDYFSRLLSGGLAITVAGHDPTVQLLAPDDLASAIALALERGPGGTYNVAPDQVIPLHAALARVHAARLPLPRGLQRHGRRLLRELGLGEPEPMQQVDYLRYSFTVSNQKIKRELGFAPTRSSKQALDELLAGEVPAGVAMAETDEPDFDDFGLDKDFVARSSRRLFDFLARDYWRIEVQGLEHVPARGKGVLVGIHRGLIAWDGAMIIHLLAQRMQRYPRFLVHPTGFQFPYAFDLTTKLGGVVACQENADYVLAHDELLGIFPEGLRGVFTLYREAYLLHKFGRHDFVKIALRHGAPIVPFVIVGSAETYPIVGKIKWDWWTRKTDWPYLPITPTLFPLIPFPLPSKWYIRFLPPLDVSQNPPAAARDAALVRELSDRVKQQMEQAIAELTSQRESLFLG